MTAILAIASAGVGYLFSLLFEFIPKFEKWHSKLSPQKKALFHGMATFIIGIVALYFSCYEQVANPLHLQCVPFDVEHIITLFLATYGGNQLSYNTVVKWRPHDGSRAIG